MVTSVNVGAPESQILAWCRGCRTWTPADEIGDVCPGMDCVDNSWPPRPRKRIRRRMFICPYAFEIELKDETITERCMLGFVTIEALDNHWLDPDCHDSEPPWHRTKEGEK